MRMCLSSTMLQLPPQDCPLCPRLVAFREANKAKFPQFYNGAVPPFGPIDAQLLVVGLAPGLKGANASGRPFTGDFAGILLYGALGRFGFSRGQFMAKPDDGLELVDARITNAVRCVPPENKPTPAEAATCNPFLVSEIGAMKNLKVILCLGLTSHQAVLKTLKQKQSAFKFGHGATHRIGNITLLDSYHTSRYNVQTGRLNQEMFDEIMAKARALIG